jgi:hypothetical protein
VTPVDVQQIQEVLNKIKAEGASPAQTVTPPAPAEEKAPAPSTTAEVPATPASPETAKP